MKCILEMEVERIRLELRKIGVAVGDYGIWSGNELILFGMLVALW